jgi:hypothetical protein
MRKVATPCKKCDGYLRVGRFDNHCVDIERERGIRRYESDPRYRQPALPPQKHAESVRNCGNDHS